jgi:hypothetical protein
MTCEQTTRIFLKSTEVKKMPNISDSVALEALCIAGFFLGATSGREAAAITVGRELSDQEWSEFGKNWNDGLDRMLLEGAHTKAEKEVRRKERKTQRENISQGVSEFKGGMKESAKKAAERLIGKGKGIINSIPNVSGSNHTEVSVEEVTSRLDKLK